MPDANTPFSITNGGIAVIDGFAAFGGSASIGGSALGAGELRIINGGLLTTVPTTFAPVIGSDFSGTVFIDAATLNWTNTGSSETLQIGNSASGIGLMTITNGGSVSLNNNSSGDGTMTLGRFGGTATLNIGTGSNAGTLNAASIGTNGTSGSPSGTGIINFNHSEADYFFTKDGTSTGTGVVVSDRIAINQIGTGKTTLISNNSYTGGTTISAGTLQIGDGDTMGSIAGDVTNNANLTFNRSDDFSFSGLISGIGALTKRGGGTLTLTRANTYSGGTTINEGTLQIGNGGEADVNSYRLGAQGTWWTPVREGQSELTQSLFTEAYLGLVYHDFDLRRASLGGDALGDTHGWQMDTGAALGYQIERAQWTFTPALALDYSRLRIDGYTESGATPLQIDTSETDSLTSTLSFRADYLLQVGKRELRPYAQIGWRHQYLDHRDSVAARFPGSNAGFFNVNGPSIGRDSLVSNVGLSTSLGEGLTAQLGYYGEHSNDFTVHSLNAALNFSF